MYVIIYNIETLDIIMLFIGYQPTNKVAFCVVIDFVQFFISKSKFFFYKLYNSHDMSCIEIIQIQY